MLNQRINTNNPAADQATIDSLIEDLLHHKRQNSEDSGVGEGNFKIRKKNNNVFFLLINLFLLRTK
jgi:hypothetical protein